MPEYVIPKDLKHVVTAALQEDVGGGDVSSLLVPEDQSGDAYILCRQEKAVICGIPWVNEVFSQLDSHLELDWLCTEGEEVGLNTKIARISGNTRAILTGERTALNFLQTLSGTATQTRTYVDLIKKTKATLLDTRKTLPGLRASQKYAVMVGGGCNHRKGLFDAYLIKENHIQSCGGITEAIKTARKLDPYLTLEIEVKNTDELDEALTAMPDIIMLDNFPLLELKKAVEINKGRVKLEASGGIGKDSVVEIAETGVDYISIGNLTKNCKAIDLSLLITNDEFL